jgi:hypothetical protein
MQMGPSRFQQRNPQFTNTQSRVPKGDIVSLTDKERDEVDFEAKMIIRQTMDRIKTMEALERGYVLFTKEN